MGAKENEGSPKLQKTLTVCCCFVGDVHRVKQVLQKQQIEKQEILSEQNFQVIFFGYIPVPSVDKYFLKFCDARRISRAFANNNKNKT